MSFRVLHPGDLEWLTRPHEPGEARRHVAELSERLGFAHTRANIWRFEPGAKGRRHRQRTQEETFVVLSGTLSMYLGDPPERVDVPPGGVVHVDAGTPLQTVNHGDADLLVYAYGYPPETETAELLDSAVRPLAGSAKKGRPGRCYRASNALVPRNCNFGGRRVKRTAI